MIDFVNLHTHTSLGSMLDATNDVNVLFAKAKELGQKALAVTDHGTMAAHYDAFKASQKTGVKFIPGCEMYFVNSYGVVSEDSKKTEKRKHLVLLAKNKVGYKNLLRANYIGFQNQVQAMGRVFPRISWDVLEKHNEGLICLTACANGPISKLLSEGRFDEALETMERLHRIFKKDLYLEIQPHHLKDYNLDQKVINEQLIELGGKYGIPLAVGADAHYITKEDEKYHDVLMAINSKKAVDDLDRHRYGIDEFYVKSGDEVYDFLTKYYDESVAIEAVSNTVKIADMCEEANYIIQTKNHLPIFDCKREQDYADLLDWRKANRIPESLAEDKALMRFRCFKAFKIKCEGLSKEETAERWARVKHELKILEGNNFSSYMLIVADFIMWAEKNGIMTGIGRGSCAGCYTAYLLGIHKVDPFKYGLIFERFQNAYKKDLPDVDTDFTSAGRDAVKDYCRKKYGQENCAHVSNIVSYSPKSVIPNLVKSMRNVMPGLIKEGENYVKVSEAIKAAIPAEYQNEEGKPEKKVSLEKALELSAELRAFAKKCPELMEYAQHIIGLPSVFSSHAAGLIIADEPIINFAPLRIDKNGSVAVQYDKHKCEASGLVKMDLLAISTLDVIDETFKNIKKLGVINAPTKLEDIPLDDENTYKMLQEGHTKCVFQLGTSTMMVTLCKKLKPKNITDIAIINALGRPSSSAEERQEFIDRRSGKKSVSYLHPSLERALKDTYGLGTFEEQLMLVAQDVAGWDLNKADGLRKLTKLKGKDPKLAEELENDFIEGAMSLHNMSREEAVGIWNKIVLPFSLYGFNKCLSGDTKVIKDDEGLLSISEIKDKINNGEKVMLKSYDVEIHQVVDDECIEVIDAGEQDVYEFTLSSGKTIKCTMEHKFLCIDYKMHTIKDIIEFDIEMLSCDGI